MLARARPDDDQLPCFSVSGACTACSVHCTTLRGPLCVRRLLRPPALMMPLLAPQKASSELSASPPGTTQPHTNHQRTTSTNTVRQPSALMLVQGCCRDGSCHSPLRLPARRCSAGLGFPHGLSPAAAAARRPQLTRSGVQCWAVARPAHSERASSTNPARLLRPMLARRGREARCRLKCGPDVRQMTARRRAGWGARRWWSWS